MAQKAMFHQKHLVTIYVGKISRVICISKTRGDAAKLVQFWIQQVHLT